MAKSVWWRTKKGFTVLAIKRETEDGLIYDGYLEHPVRGRKKVLMLHEKTIEDMGIKNGRNIVDLICARINEYITWFEYSENGIDYMVLPMWTFFEEENGYSWEWPLPE